MINKKWLLIVFVLAVLGIVFSLRANTSKTDHEIALIREEIAEKGLSWVAGETSMTRLSPEERLMRLGAIKSYLIKTNQDNEIEPTLALPPTLDWRNNSGNWVTSIKNQGNCGSCWAFAVTGVLESVIKIAKNNHKDINLSEQTLVSCSGAGSCLRGGFMDEASEYIRLTGIPRESCFPYAAADSSCNPCDDWQNHTARITAWKIHHYERNIQLETELQSGPITATMTVYSDFFHYESGIYERTPSSMKAGLHAIIIIGYNVPEQYWICKNSWGTDWGESGFFRIRMHNSDIATECESMIGPLFEENHPPVLKAIPEQNVEEGKNLSFNLSATDADNDPLTFSASSLPNGVTLDAHSGAFSWTPTFSESGIYNVKFSVTDGQAKVDEMVKITVINVKIKKW